ncbi:MAG TPA: ABC transporter substrate-binding protein [Chloroflexota bacterium]
MSFKDPKDPEKFQGFEVDMMDAVMKHLNRSYKFKEISFNGLLPGVQAGQINMIVSDLYIKPEREQVVDFVPYLQSSHGLMVKAGNPKKISSYADVCGKTAGALQGGADVQNLQKVNTDVCSTGGRQPIKLQQYQSVPQEVVELDNGRIDVIEEDELSLGYIQKQNPGKYDLSFHDPDAIKSGIAIKKGDSELLNSLKSGFDWFKTSGEYAKTADKWGIPKAALLQ